MKPRLWLLLLTGCASADITLPNNPVPPPPAGASGAALAVYETPAVLSAAQLLGPEVAGATYRVREPVPTDGYMARFSIDSDFGEFECIGITQVKTRIREMAAPPSSPSPPAATPAGRESFSARRS